MVSADSPTWNWILLYSGTIGGGMYLKAGIAIRQKKRQQRRRTAEVAVRSLPCQWLVR